MSRLNLLIATLLALFAAQVGAQSFPNGPITVYCPCLPSTANFPYMQAYAGIASKYLGQTITVRLPPSPDDARIGDYVSSARPDGHELFLMNILVFRLPHLYQVSWHPVRDFTYVIGLIRFTFGIVVRSDSPFKSLDDLIGFAKSNPGKLRYGVFPRGGTQHLAVEEMGLKAGARFSAEFARFEDSMKALEDGRILAISDSTVWAPRVDSGVLRLLVTFGERRSRWNAPTANELGLDIFAYSPSGIVGPKGMDPGRVKILHDAFNRALDDPEYDKLVNRLELVDWYKSSEDYADWAIDQFRFQGDLLKRTIGVGR
jgi:tripartite-type tricarboxylate transporter receptor subunit TctC